MVGKVNMDRNSPDYLREKSWRESVSRTEEYIDELKGFKNVRPIITPRFVPSCTDELMEGLKGIIEKTGLPVQSHLSENPEEIAWVKELCPDCPTYGDVYDKYGMLSASSIMAHCVHLTEREIMLLKDRGAFVAHCPESNMNLASGIAPVSRLLHEGINVGLGSDVAGGTTLSIPAARLWPCRTPKYTGGISTINILLSGLKTCFISPPREEVNSSERPGRLKTDMSLTPLCLTTQT